MEEFVIGGEVAGYRLASVLGVGGMGTVYLAEDLRRGGRVALKILAPELHADDASRKRFLREAGYARSVSHPHVVRLIEAGVAGGAIFIAMEYVDGGDLAAILRRERRLDPGRATRLLMQIAVALDAVHDAGLVHRDVKPANCIVAGTGAEERALLTDFGVSRSLRDDSAALTGTGDFVGTHFYTAPEQLFGDPDPRADVYSLGCVLYECLAGQPPFPFEDVAAVLEAHVDQPPPSLTALRPDLPPALAAVIAKALSKSPAGRHPTCVALITAATEAWTDQIASVPQRLVLSAGGVGGAEVEVEDELILGRESAGFGQLAIDATASRRHARIGRTPAGWFVEDLGSRNGTLLNNQAVTGPARLADGDRLEVGSTLLTVLFAPKPPAREPVARPPTLSVRLELDPTQRQGSVGFDGSAPGARLALEGGRWRLRQAPPA